MQDRERDSTEREMRLQVYLARCGAASRRGAERLIAEGRVSVNGTTIREMGAKVSAGDKVLLDGRRLELEIRTRYVLLNKPAGYVCSMADEKGRPVAADLLGSAYPERLYNVGRLDMFSEGLIIFTNDGDFARLLSHPSANLEKEYVVDTSLPLPDGLCESFMRGIRIDGVFYKCKSARAASRNRARIVLIEGKNREIRRVFDSFGARIRRLKRVRIGCVGAEGLRPGEFRSLSNAEVESLVALCRQHNSEGNYNDENFEVNDDSSY